MIFFLGDGMGVSTVTSARIYYGQKQGKSGEEGYLSFEKFPNVALAKVRFCASEVHMFLIIYDLIMPVHNASLYRRSNVPVQRPDHPGSSIREHP